jgi:adenine deaminase
LSIEPFQAAAFQLKAKDGHGDFVTCKVIDAKDGQLITGMSTADLKVTDGNIMSDVLQDVLKIGVVNRYKRAPVSLGFIRNFGLKKGAIASSVAHDSHNIVFVGVDDVSICEAVNAIVNAKGGISLFDETKVEIMPLPIAGLMSEKSGYEAGNQYEILDAGAKALGSTLAAPFMTLSFMALPVIPALKITDKGLFDVNKFDFLELS